MKRDNDILFFIKILIILLITFYKHFISQKKRDITIPQEFQYDEKK